MTVTERTPPLLPGGPVGEPRTALLVGDPRRRACPARGLGRVRGLTDPGARLWLRWWPDAEAAARVARRGVSAGRHRMVRVIRDYSMVDRAEAPQYYPPVSTPEVG